VDAQKTLTLIGNVIVNGTTFVNGTLTAAYDAATATAAQVYLATGLALDAAAQFTINASVSVTVDAQATLDGTVYLAQNAYLFLRAAGSHITRVVVTGANATIQCADSMCFISVTASLLSSPLLIVW
jgi:hypothetical protein